jgi:molecular chaperone GrpE
MTDPKRRAADDPTDRPAEHPDDEFAAAPDTDPDEEPDYDRDDGAPAVDPDDELARLARESDGFREKWLRTAAELENLRKRTHRELSEGRKFAVADVVRPLLDVVDDFERAVASFAQYEEDAGCGEMADGVGLIFQSLQTLLAERGVRRIEAQDRAFDPALHEAIGQQERPGVPEGTIVEVVQHGYLLDDLLLRPSRVIVAAGA